uniref:Uncharacterized protein n=1 Tax=Anguilla anguilla TaxID=7936 RepID=A0A0E9T5T9_ANGAN
MVVLKLGPGGNTVYAGLQSNLNCNPRILTSCSFF